LIERPTPMKSRARVLREPQRRGKGKKKEDIRRKKKKILAWPVKVISAADREEKGGNARLTRERRGRLIHVSFAIGRGVR